MKTPVHHHEYDDRPDWSEEIPFTTYVLQVGQVLRAAGAKGATTGDIHRVVGTDRRHLTLLALERLSDVETVGVLPTRYRFFQQPRRLLLPSHYNGQKAKDGR